MATVNITPKLVLEITKNVSAPFADRYQIASIASRDDSIKLYDNVLITPEQSSLLKQLPDNWVRLSHTKQLTHKLYIGHKNAVNTKLHYVRLDLPSDERFYDYSWSYSPNTAADHVEKTNSSWVHADLTALGLSKDYPALLEAICEERNQLVGTVEKMLEGCKTLNQVEKVWPAIRKYVGPEICARLDKKSVRTRTARDVGITDEELQALSVHHIRQQMTA